MVVAWWLGNSDKIAHSVIPQNESFIYNTANAALRPRFSVSSASFSGTLFVFVLYRYNSFDCMLHCLRLVFCRFGLFFLCFFFTTSDWF